MDSNRLRSTLLATLMACAAAGSACADDEDGTGPATDPDKGSIQTTVSAAGAGVSGIGIGLFEREGSAAVQTRSTDGDGTALFVDLEPGAWEVAVTDLSGRALVDGEAVRKPAAVVAGEQTEVSFMVEPAAGDRVVEVIVSGNLTFEPTTVTITPGTTVRWINAQAMAHTVTPDGHEEWVDTSLGEAGETFEHTFTTPGEFPYYCQPHVGLGMRGTIRVEP